MLSDSDGGTRIPFSVYDFFGYLVSGFLLVVATDYILGMQWVLKDSLGIIFGILWTIIAYIVGQIIASPSAWLYEDIVIGKWLMRPNIILMQDRRKVWWTKMFSGYSKPLPMTTRKIITEKAKNEGINAGGEALFIHIFGKVKAGKDETVRLNTFLSMYGFCRNVSFALLLITIVIVLTCWRTATWDKLPWAFAAAGGAVGMFYRYLKFFRQYSYELFVTYAGLTEEGVKSGN